MGKSEEVKKAPADKKEKRELLEFTLGENRYGVDIGVVSEIRQYQVPTRVPNVQPYVEGVFISRQIPITVIGLSIILETEFQISEKKDVLIVTNHHDKQMAFHVQEVNGIRNVSSEDIMPFDEMMGKANQNVAVGIVKLDNRNIIVLDLEGLMAASCASADYCGSEVNARSIGDEPL